MTKTSSPPIKTQQSNAVAPRQTKAALLRARLARPGGVSLTEMMHLTGWQAHTLRAALTGLRKTGVNLSRHRDGGETVYAIDRAEPADADLAITAHVTAALPVAARGLPDATISDSGKGAA